MAKKKERTWTITIIRSSKSVNFKQVSDSPFDSIERIGLLEALKAELLADLIKTQIKHD